MLVSKKTSNEKIFTLIQLELLFNFAKIITLLKCAKIKYLRYLNAFFILKRIYRGGTER